MKQQKRYALSLILERDERFSIRGRRKWYFDWMSHMIGVNRDFGSWRGGYCRFGILQATTKACILPLCSPRGQNGIIIVLNCYIISFIFLMMNNIKLIFILISDNSSSTSSRISSILKSIVILKGRTRSGVNGSQVPGFRFQVERN